MRLTYVYCLPTTCLAKVADVYGYTRESVQKCLQRSREYREISTYLALVGGVLGLLQQRVALALHATGPFTSTSVAKTKPFCVSVHVSQRVRRREQMSLVHVTQHVSVRQPM